MEFKIECAEAGKVVFSNKIGQRVAILGTKKQQVLASGSLMGKQIDMILAAHAEGKQTVEVPQMVW